MTREVACPRCEGSGRIRALPWGCAKASLVAWVQAKEHAFTSAEAASTLAIEAHYARTLISRMCQSGHIERVGYGRYQTVRQTP